jgi:hypothetical protein
LKLTIFKDWKFCLKRVSVLDGSFEIRSIT